MISTNNVVRVVIYIFPWVFVLSGLFDDSWRETTVGIITRETNIFQNRIKELEIETLLCERTHISDEVLYEKLINMYERVVGKMFQHAATINNTNSLSVPQGMLSLSELLSVIKNNNPAEVQKWAYQLHSFRSPSEETSLQLAIEYESLDIVSSLCNLSNYRDHVGCTSFCTAIAKGNSSVNKLLSSCNPSLLIPLLNGSIPALWSRSSILALATKFDHKSNIQDKPMLFSDYLMEVFQTYLEDREALRVFENDFKLIKTHLNLSVELTSREVLILRELTGL